MRPTSQPSQATRKKNTPSAMAFVAAAPVLSARSSMAGRAVTPTKTAPESAAVARRAPAMAIEFQTYSGGLDQKSIDPYKITRYLFKRPPASTATEDKDSVIAAGLRQLFGNAYLMEEERAEFYVAESKFRCGEITAREFARAVAKSETYRKRFFDSVTQFRFIELNFKHFLGRAPLNQVEYSKHFKIFAEGGFEAEIDSYFDDDEYDSVFGDDVMPYTRFRGTYAPINQFNRMCTLEGGFAGSDKNKGQTLVTSLAANVPTPAYSVVDGLPAISNAEHPTKKYDLPAASLERFRNELELASARSLQLQIELQNAYDDLARYRSGFNPFRAMVADMDISSMTGAIYKTQDPVYPTWSEGTPKPWGTNGVDTLNGPTKRQAAVISQKEKQLERTKQLVVDLERRVSVLEADREKPALTPEPLQFELEGLPVVQVFAEEEEEEVVEDAFGTMILSETAAEQAFDPSTIITQEVDVEDESSGIVVPKTVEISTKREFADVGKLPKELIEEMEEEKKASGKEFLGPQDGRLRFPGDGSEMIIGG